MQEKQLKAIQNKIASWIKEIESAFIDELFSKIGPSKMLRSKLMLALLNEKQTLFYWIKHSICADCRNDTDRFFIA